MGTWVTLRIKLTYHICSGSVCFAPRLICPGSGWKLLPFGPQLFTLVEHYSGLLGRPSPRHVVPRVIDKAITPENWTTLLDSLLFVFAPVGQRALCMGPCPQPLSMHHQLHRSSLKTHQPCSTHPGYSACGVAGWVRRRVIFLRDMQSCQDEQ